jgi:hypothetical protein
MGSNGLIMTQNIPEVQDTPKISSAEFVKLTVFNDFADPTDTSIYTFSSAYKQETIDGQVYLPLGGLLAVGAQNRDLRVTSGDTVVALSGIGANNIFLVLGTKIRGSEILISRGFYNDSGILGNSYIRFRGIVTSYAIQEDREGDTDDFSCAVSASSYVNVLGNRIAGRKTNEESWKSFNPTDTSMDQVYSIAGVNFDFGGKATSKTTIGGGGGGGGDGDGNRRQRR